MTGYGDPYNRYQWRTPVETWVWILIVAAVILILVIAFFAVRKGSERKVEKKREEADSLRHEAQERLAVSGEREARAEQEAERAARERAVAREQIQRAEDVDPDVPNVDREDDDSGARRAER
jgi:flagellar biosynthesis/type III secretory pathway M-ring protein FliF/YscJ